MCSFETTVSMSIIRVLSNFVRIKYRENNSFLDNYKITLLPKQLDRFKLCSPNYLLSMVCKLIQVPQVNSISLKFEKKIWMAKT